MVQKLCEIIGKDGCYFLSILKAAEIKTTKEINPIAAYNLAIKNRWMREDCFMWRPEALLSHLTGITWTCEKVEGVYRGNASEIIIQRYEVVEGRSTLAHFVLASCDGTILYDPYGKSNCVQNGRVVSSRVFRRA